MIMLSRTALRYGPTPCLISIPNPFSIQDFAEVTLLKIYQMTHDGELPPGISEECMQYQLDFFDDIPLFDLDTMFGNTCNIEADDLNLGARCVLFSSLLATPAYG